MKHAADTEFSGQNTQHIQRSDADLPRREVIGLPLVDATARATIESVLAPGRRTVAFLNAHCANVMARDPSYADALRRADMILPDGIGVELAARMTGQRLAANLNGTDFVPALLREARQRGLSVFLFGGTPGTADRAADRLCRDMPGLRVVGTRDGYAGAADEAAAIDAINASGADILIVAMGVPLQDVWLARNAERLAPRVRLGVGALFDFLAGNVRRAPHAVRKARCEWVWRLAIEPRRMARRYLVGNATFMARAALHALRSVDPIGLRKRLLDLTLAGLAAVALSPLLLLVILAIRLDSPGPAFYRQTRVGKDGTPFPVLKFRSMYTDAEERRAALLAQSDRAGICFKSRNDPRVTRIGRFLRRSSLDELPQIFNVLRGEMSLVGPRPALPQEVAAYPAQALGRLRVKPGITGLWQVSGRADISFDKMIDMDLAYGASRSTLLDLMIIFLTFRTVLSGRGAY
ncbi:WecB/TagA/CpsF family glycosyltransferase [Salipiger mangrovisoli]|uniref:WecB/TagA/CpsF family glycosyltransferase n=1 Tax=Salipiger mangrovisoli TaxID=2865933 RepID=A0ABR9X5N5_9RHOB|nr:WecB/TagA/CpsF family glycosyltransferase [Salipiger mangrovisoli]MBE9638752.1 WecB/TagA/CpsF family glycosyltransferase [Salipiger mangrovisoli]